MPHFITALLAAAALVLVLAFVMDRGCMPGQAYYFERHEILADGGIVRMYPVYVCRSVPADR